MWKTGLWKKALTCPLRSYNGLWLCALDSAGVSPLTTKPDLARGRGVEDESELRSLADDEDSEDTVATAFSSLSAFWSRASFLRGRFAHVELELESRRFRLIVFAARFSLFGGRDELTR